MKFLLFFVSLISFNLFAQDNPYERTIKACNIDINEGETTTVHFILDNDWLFVSEVGLYDESKLYMMDKLIGARAFITTGNSRDCALEMICENPFNKGKPRISFLGAIPKVTYDELLVVADLQFTNYYICGTGVITLSDGSKWDIKDNLGVGFASSHWAVGDHVAITRKFDEEDRYYLVNLDVSGDTYIDYHQSYKEHWYSVRDARNILAAPVKRLTK